MKIKSSFPGSKQRIIRFFLQVAWVCHREQQTNLEKWIHAVDQDKGRKKIKSVLWKQTKNKLNQMTIFNPLVIFPLHKLSAPVWVFLGFR